MKHLPRLSLIAIIFSLVAGLVVLPTVRAYSGGMDDAHASRIRANCVTAQASLNRLHANDALMRVNQGQTYELISTKLMASLGSRIALNHLDGSKLSQIAATYAQNLDIFRTNYQIYEQQLSSALSINCVNQPVAFYDAVNSARAKRDTVHTSIIELNKNLTDYSAAFGEFSATLMSAPKGVSLR